MSVCIAASVVAAIICFKKAHELSKGETLVSWTDADGTEWVKRLSLAEEQKRLEMMENFLGRDPGMEEVLRQQRASIERRKSRHTTFKTGGKLSLLSTLGFTIWTIWSWVRGPVNDRGPVAQLADARSKGLAPTEGATPERHATDPSRSLLARCPRCGNMVLFLTESCPGCGANRTK